MPAVAARFLLFFSLLVLANSGFGHGAYQRTKNGKTILWNNFPHPGDTATWSGGRDREGFGSGFGILSWYTLPRDGGATVSSSTAELYARYFGNMVRGKFNGPVNVHLRSKTEHAVFIDGQRVTQWAIGPTRSWRIPRALIQPPKEAYAAGPHRPEPEPPAEGPLVIRPALKNSSKPPMTSGFADDVDDSLRLLAWPPSSLRANAGARPSPNEVERPAPLSAHPRLTGEEVIALADAGARGLGYDLVDYERPEPQFDPVDQIWSLFYDQKPDVGMEQMTRHFTVAVDDKTRKTAIVPGR